MSSEKEESISNPPNEVKDRKYGIGITRFFKVLGKDERPKPSINPIEHMKFVNKSAGKPRKRAVVSQAKRRKGVGANLPTKTKSNAVDLECKSAEKDVEIAKEPTEIPKRLKKSKKAVNNCNKASTGSKRRLRKRSDKSSEDVSKESSDPYSVDDSEDSELIMSYSAFLKDNLLKKKPSDQLEDSNGCNNANQTQSSIKKYFSLQNGKPKENNNVRNKNKKKKVCLDGKGKKHLEAVVHQEAVKSLKRSSRKSSEKIEVNLNDETNLRRSSRLRKPIMQDLPVENLDDESVQSVDGFVQDKYACKVSVVDEKDGKQSIKLRLTRISDKCKKSKVIVEKAQKLIRKSKRTAAKTKKTSKAEVKEAVEDEADEEILSVTQPDVVIIDDDEKSKCSIAPIFLKSNNKLARSFSPQLDEETVERRKQFLRSGIPISLQQQIETTAESESSHREFLFPTVGHVTQSDDDFSGNSSALKNFQLKDEEDASEDLVCPQWKMGLFTQCHTKNSSVPDTKKLNVTLTQSLVKLRTGQLPKLLDEIQEQNQSKNVLSIYNSYASRKDPAYLSELQSIKKRPLSTVSSPEDKGGGSGMKKRKTNRNGVEQIVAKIKQKSIQSSGDETECTNFKSSNSEPNSDLWTSIYKPESSSDIIVNDSSVNDLKSFLVKWRSIGKCHGNKNYEIDSSDGSESVGEGESRAALVIGPLGCGKTVAVYTIAKELGYKVLEINASSKRSSKLILSQLQEATQSRRVKEATIHALFKQPDASKPQLETATMSLILFEDVDIVFLEDEGFWSAINEFISTTKIPVVLTTSDVKFCEKNHIKGDYETIKFRELDLNSQVVHIQILCLTDNWFLNSNDIYQLLNYNRGNFRQTLLYLHYLCNSESGYRQLVEESEKKNAIMTSESKSESESSTNNFCTFNYDLSSFHRDVLFVMCKYLHIAKYRLLSNEISSAKKCEHSNSTSNSTSISNLINDLVKRLDDLCVMDSMFGFERFEPKNSRARILDGLEDDKERTSNLTWFENQLTLDLEDTLFNTSSGLSIRLNCENCSVESDVDHDVLYQSILSLNQDITYSRKCMDLHDNISTHLHAAHRLNARAFSLDLLPSLRAICRSEKEKQGVSNKRSGRFLHYLTSNAIYFEPCTISQLCKNLGPDYFA
ncbi:hypothetical protein CHUAL_007939 [Chamberlinius hualienensis]